MEIEIGGGGGGGLLALNPKCAFFNFEWCDIIPKFPDYSMIIIQKTFFK